MSVIDFYDELAPEYHLIYEDWNAGTHVPSLTTLSRLAEAAGERL